MLLSTVASAADDKTITVWYYKQNLGPLLESTFASLSKKLNIKITQSFLTTHDLKTALIKSSVQGQGPDLVLAPSDFISERNAIDLSNVSKNQFPTLKNANAWKSVTSEGQLMGVPLLLGNHLVLYYNKSLVKKPMSSWEEFIAYRKSRPTEEHGPIGWNFGEMYWFIAFSTMFNDEVFVPGKINLNTKGAAQTLSFLKTIVDEGVIKTECGSNCGFADFVEGRRPYSLNGDWAYRDFSSSLKDNLGIAKLPTWKGKAMHSYFSSVAWIFPNDSLNSSKKSKLIAIVNETLKMDFQKSIFEEIKVMPVMLQNDKKFIQARSGIFVDLLNGLEGARPIPVVPSTSASWAGLKKGFDFFWSTKSPPERAAMVMQRVADRELMLIKQRSKR